MMFLKKIQGLTGSCLVDSNKCKNYLEFDIFAVKR